MPFCRMMVWGVWSKLPHLTRVGVSWESIGGTATKILLKSDVAQEFGLHRDQ
ncbi:MAG: hypothetical protein ACP5GU_08050 [Thermoprotei archaeon]